MPRQYVDQFYRMDPGNPPAAGTRLIVERAVFNDQNDNGVIRGNTGDTFQGSQITQVWVNDTVTIRPAGGGADITYTGTTFYTADGARVFTPRGNAILEDGSFVRSTFVTSATQIGVNQFGPTCFAPGTRIATAWGSVPIEEIVTGTMVQTMDNGPQQVRHVTCRRESGTGHGAPVVIEAGVMGNARRLALSQQHRVLHDGWRAELHFGAAEVLVAAKHLTGQPGVFLAPCRDIIYRHLLLDRHEVIFAEGVAVESFNPGDLALNNDPELCAEIEAVLPGLARASLAMRAVARQVVRGADAAVLAQ